MILLDTNVVSEVMRPAPDPNVMAWLGTQNTSDLWISTVSTAEIMFGLALLPDGRRQQHLVERFEKFLTLGFRDRVLPFGDVASASYAEIMAHRRRSGRAMHVLDGLIAATAKTQNMALATRNIRDFDNTGIDLLDPWQSEN